MTKEEIILRVLRLDREQLLALQRLLDQLEGRQENQIPWTGPDQGDPGSGK